LAEGTDPNDPDSFSVPSFAGELALMIEEGTVGNQAFGGSLGADFVVDQTIRVLELGAFDSGSDGLSRAITVKMWSREDSGTPEVPADDSGIAVLAEVEFTPNFPGDLRGGYRTISLTDPLVLEPGAYTIVAGGYGPGEPNGNNGTPGMSTTEDPIITFVGGSRYGTDPLSYPDTPDGGPANRYAAGTFAFEIPGGAGSGLIVYDAEEDTVGNQAFEGSLGMDFELSSGLTVTELGVFDSGSDGLTLPITVELWERDEDFGLEILSTLDFGPDDEGVLEGGHRFKALPESINLPAGSYTIVAYGYGAGEPNVNASGNPAANYGLSTNDAGGVISFVGGSRWGNAGEFPGNADGGPAQRYGGGTFKVITAAGAKPTISLVRNADGTVTVTFDGTLQVAPTVNGPWQDVDGESPLTISPDQPATFGRAVSE